MLWVKNSANFLYLHVAVTKPPCPSPQCIPDRVLEGDVVNGHSHTVQLCMALGCGAKTIVISTKTASLIYRYMYMYM